MSEHEANGFLNEICTLRKESCNPRKFESGVYIGLEHIDSGKFFLNSHGSPNDVRSSKNMFFAGDVLYGKLRPYLDKAVVAHCDGICSTDILVLKPGEQTPSCYLAGVLHTDIFIDYAKQTTHGVNHPRTSWTAIRDYQLKNHSLAEQKKIAAVLFKIQKAIEVQESIIKTTQELKKSTMQYVFTYGLHGEKTKETEIGKMPESWEKITIRKLGEIITGTTPPTTNKEYYHGGGYQFIAPADFGKTTKIYTALKEISAKGLDVSRVLPKDSICFVCIGSTIGKAGITVKVKAATNQQINSIIVKDTLDPYFVMYLLTFKSEYIASFASPSPVPILSKGKFEEIEIMICPDKKEQNEIAYILKTIDQKIEHHTAKKNALQDLFKTMLNRLMTEDIRVKGFGY